MLVPDVAEPGLVILFVGYNPGMKSGETGHHFAGPGNWFWDLLADSHLTPQRLSYTEDRNLLHYSIGIVNLVDRPTPSSADLNSREREAGAGRLRRKIEQMRPQVAAFLGKDIFRSYRGMRPSAPVSWGVQRDAVVAGLREVVLPNPSRRSTMPYAVRLGHFQELAGLIRAL